MTEIVLKEGDVVLDPFSGSGTTAVGCKNLGRKFIGIEISQLLAEMLSIISVGWC